jgi:beta-fructofuranosidase
MWECPDFFALGNQHVLIVSVFDNQRLSEFAHLPMIHHAVYFAGTYADQRLAPAREGMVDYGHSLYAPQSFADEHGRRIMFGWLREERSGEAQIAAGWSGAMSLPRVLGLRSDGHLSMGPAAEVECLRGRRRRWEDLDLRSAEPYVLPDAHSDTIEIMAEIALGNAAEAGLSVRCAPDDAEATRIVYDRAAQQLIVDCTRASLDPSTRRDACGAPLQLADGEQLKLRVFVDRSIIEVFANHDTCVTRRVYPTRPDSLGVKLFSRGGNAHVISLDLWKMDTIWPKITRYHDEHAKGDNRKS